MCGNKGVCIPSYQDDSAECNCSDGYSGKPCSEYKGMSTNTISVHVFTLTEYVTGRHSGNVTGFSDRSKPSTKVGTQSKRIWEGME